MRNRSLVKISKDKCKFLHPGGKNSLQWYRLGTDGGEQLCGKGSGGLGKQKTEDETEAPWQQRKVTATWTVWAGTHRKCQSTTGAGEFLRIRAPGIQVSELGSKSSWWGLPGSESTQWWLGRSMTTRKVQGQAKRPVHKWKAESTGSTGVHASAQLNWRLGILPVSLKIRRNYFPARTVEKAAQKDCEASLHPERFSGLIWIKPWSAWSDSKLTSE